MSSPPRDVRMKGFSARTRVADAEALLVERLARLHSQRRGWNAAMADGSASMHVEIRPEWSVPLP